MDCPLDETEDFDSTIGPSRPNTFFVAVDADCANAVPPDVLKLEVENHTHYSCTDCYQMALQLITHQMNYHRTHDPDKRQNAFDILINIADHTQTSYANGSVDCEIVIDITRPLVVTNFPSSYNSNDSDLLVPVKREPFEPEPVHHQYDEDHRSDFDACDQQHYVKLEPSIAEWKPPPVTTHRPKKARKKPNPSANQWKCSICKRKYKNEINLQTHYKKYHTGPTARPPSAFKKVRKPTPMNCDYCGKLLMSKCKMANHFVDDHGFTISYTCRECGATFTNSLLLIRHRRDEHSRKPFKCQYGCDAAQFSCSYSLSQHNAAVHGQYDTVYICDMCGEQFPHRYIILAHFRKHHMAKRKPDIRISCKVCQREFAQRSTLKQHMNKHTGAKPHRCQHGCDRSFSSKSGQAQHHARYHDGPKFQCDLCSKMFYLQTQLKMHKIRHTGVRPFACEICNKTYATKTCLKSHLSVHQNQRHFHCELCNTSFYSSRHLQRHQNRRTPCNVEPEPIVCGVCNESFMQKSLYNRHLREHEKDERYKCDRCDTEFFIESQLRRHQAKKKSCKKEPLEISVAGDENVV